MYIVLCMYRDCSLPFEAISVWIDKHMGRIWECLHVFKGAISIVDWK